MLAAGLLLGGIVVVAMLMWPFYAFLLTVLTVPLERIVPHPPDDLRGALLAFVEATPIGTTGYVLPTYTAMLEIRRILADLGVVQAFWRQ